MIQQKYSAEIDGLRAIAVMGVVLFHFEIFPLSGGFTGVDIFFVISGFLITQNIMVSLQNGTFSFTNFYISRVRRLFPALWITWLFTLILGFLLFTPEHYLRLSKSLISSIFSISNFFFWQEAGYFDTSLSFKPLLHTWSLSVEEQFYFIWPVTLFFLYRRQKTKTILIFLILVGTVSLLTSEKWLSIDPTAAFYLTPFRVIEFAIGALLVWAIRFQPKNKLLLEPLLLFGLTLIFYSFFAYSKATPFPGITALLPCLGAALLIYSQESNFCGWLLRNPVSVGIGLISYSLYLIHWPVIIFYKYWNYKEITSNEQIGLLGLTILLAYLSYKYIEQPFRKGGMLSSNYRQKTFALLCIPCSALLITCSAFIIKEKGAPQRISSKFAQLQDIEKFNSQQYGGNGFHYLTMIGEKRGRFRDYDALLVGDSFARQYAAGIHTLFKRANIMATNVTDYSCIVGPDVTYLDKGKIDKNCINVSKRFFDLFKEKSKPVILSQAWKWYDVGICDLEGNPIKFKNQKESNQFFVNNIKKIRTFMGEEQKLIIIGNPPGSGNQNGILTCVNRPNYLPNNCLESMSFERAYGIGYDINAVLRAYAEKENNTFFLDPFDAFCDQEKCYALDYKKNKIWYSDGAHVSIDGSIKVANYFIDDFVRLIKDEPEK